MKEVPVGDAVTNDELLGLDCDVLIPAALENAIDDANASAVRAPLVVEAANHPVTPEADASLRDGGVTVVPDILANAGGVTGSYFEWTANLTAFRWSEDRFNGELLSFLGRAFESVWERHLERQVDLRTAAYMVGIAGWRRRSGCGAWPEPPAAQRGGTADPGHPDPRPAPVRRLTCIHMHVSMTAWDRRTTCPRPDDCRPPPPQTWPGSWVPSRPPAGSA